MYVYFLRRCRRLKLGCSFSQLSLPHGLRFRTQKHNLDSNFHSFIVTQKDGQRYYGFSLVFYEKAHHEICGAMQTLQVRSKFQYFQNIYNQCVMMNKIHDVSYRRCIWPKYPAGRRKWQMQITTLARFPDILRWCRNNLVSYRVITTSLKMCCTLQNVLCSYLNILMCMPVFSFYSIYSGK
mgnify:CR=1 FL=1